MPFDAQKFSKVFIKTKAKRYIHEFLNRIGKDTLQYIISRDKNIIDYIPKDKIERYKEAIRDYSWAVGVVKDEDVLDLLPDWAGDLKEKHRDWFLRQISILRNLVPSEKIEETASDIFECECGKVLAIPPQAKEGMKIRCPSCKAVYILERRREP